MKRKPLTARELRDLFNNLPEEYLGLLVFVEGCDCIGKAVEIVCIHEKAEIEEPRNGILIRRDNGVLYLNDDFFLNKPSGKRELESGKR